MGYRSNIRVMTNLEGFELMQEMAWDIAMGEEIADNMVLFPVIGQDPDNFFDYYDAQEDYLCFGVDWVKWYDDYEDVALFMDVLEKADEKGVKWQFMRVGEDTDDIEMLSSDNFYDNQIPVMYAHVEIMY